MHLFCYTLKSERLIFGVSYRNINESYWISGTSTNDLSVLDIHYALPPGQAPGGAEGFPGL